jgi:hypothetical protein
LYASISSAEAKPLVITVPALWTTTNSRRSRIYSGLVQARMDDPLVMHWKDTISPGRTKFTCCSLVSIELFRCIFCKRTQRRSSNKVPA